MDYEEIKQEAKLTGCKVTDLLALAPQNDPFYIGQPSQMEAARWFAGMMRRFGYGRGVHLRRIHYRAVSQDPPILKPNGKPYENTQNDWGFLGNASKYARYLDLVSVDDFVDRRNPDPIVNAQFEAESEPSWRALGGDWWGYHTLPNLPQLPDLPYGLPDLPDFYTDGYKAQQPYLVEVWAEKTTMNDVLEPLCRRFGANLVTGAGELSVSAVVAFLGRVRDADRPARILYVSDFDPAGLGLPISFARKIEFFQRQNGDGELDIKLEPVILTEAQVASYSLPRVPVKDSDKRKANFEAAHGEGQVELDALEAIYPGELESIVRAAILAYYDPTLEERTREQETALSDALAEERRAILDGYAEELEELESEYSDLRADFAKTRDRFAELVAGFQEEIDAHRERLQGIREQGEELHGRIYDDLAGAETDAEDYPLPEPDLAYETNGLLYESDRDYFEQLACYHAHRGGDN
jgi:hypothetical protein